MEYRPHPQHPWHTLTVEETGRLLAVVPEHGLSEAEAIRRQSFGENSLPTTSAPGLGVRLWRQCAQPLVAILIVAAVVEAGLGQVVDACVIGGVVLVNVAMGLLQESQAQAALAALARTMASRAMVLRQDVWQRRPARELVPGDVVGLRAGDKLPADVRLFSVQGLAVDESALTGESLPVDKATAPVPPDTPLADQTGLALSATVVVRGQGRGLVVRIGRDTVIGRLAARTAAVKDPTTPLTRKLNRFSNLILVAILGLAGLAFVVGLWRGQPAGALFTAAVALAVGAIPEGLPAAVTAILAMGAARLARRRAVIRHLPAVETLGAATVICTDKTGTLTQNRLVVAELYAADTHWRPDRDDGLRPDDPTRDGPAARAAVAACARVAGLCNDAAAAPDVADAGQAPVRPFSGDPIETALLDLSRRAGLSRNRLEGQFPRLDEIPFAAERQFMATLHDAGPAAPRLVLFKGSVEAALARSRDGDTDLAAAEAFRLEAERMGRRGLRVLALAGTTVPPGKDRLDPADLAHGLTLFGLAGLLDPPRPEAAPAIAACRRAGIQVKMITGDQASTAAAVGARVGLGRESELTVITGAELAAVDDAALPRLAEATTIFARVAPEQKLRIIAALRSLGQVTAMTGDGVNDAPALRQADIGVAMGGRGADAAREAAKLVLTDDNFATLAAAVAEGRGIFDNLTKYIVWTLPANLGEGLVILAGVLAGAALPISPVQILWINMTTAGSLGLTLAFEPREPDVMDRPPRDPGRPILDAVLVCRVLLVGGLLLAASFGLFAWELARGASQAVARTVAVNVFVAVEAGYLLNCRSLSHPAWRLPLAGNPWVLGGLAATVALQGLFTYAPFMQTLFGSAAIGPGAWLRIAGVGGLAFCLVEAEKLVRRAK